jgi:hypothetical protein
MVAPIDRSSLATLCADIFEADRRGALIFEYLTARWVQRPRREGGIDAVLDMARCAAYREVLDDLVLLINEGRDPTPAAPPGDDG